MSAVIFKVQRNVERMGTGSFQISINTFAPIGMRRFFGKILNVAPKLWKTQCDCSPELAYMGNGDLAWQVLSTRVQEREREGAPSGIDENGAQYFRRDPEYVSVYSALGYYEVVY